MSAEECNDNLPVILVDCNENWKRRAKKEMEKLKTLFGNKIYNIHHIGSTAIKNIKAKPIIDILIELEDLESFEEISLILKNAGYCDSKSSYFFKGYDIANGYGEKAFNVHIKAKGEILQVLFRDYLNTHPHAAQDYEDLKVRLAKKYSHERDTYTLCKRRYVEDINTLAIEELVKNDPEKAKEIPPYLFPISLAQMLESAKTGEPVKDCFGRSTGLVMKAMN